MISFKRFASAALAGVMVVGTAAMFGCSSQTGSSSSVAATVDGVDVVMEQEVTDYVESFRNYSSLTESADWAAWLGENSFTAASVRDMTIDMYVQEYLMRKDAESKGITVSEDEVTTAINGYKGEYSDEAWVAYLETAGMTEESFKEQVEVALLAEKITASLDGASDVSDEDVLEQSKFLGGKDVSALFVPYDAEASDEEKAASKDTAQKYISEIKSGKKLSEIAEGLDSESAIGASEDGHIGWSSLSYLPETMVDALDSLGTNDVSDEPIDVTDSSGYVVLYVNDTFEASEGLTIEDVPSQIKEYVVSYLEASAGDEALNAYAAKLVEEADVRKTDMPQGLPYDVEPSETATNASTNATTEQQ